MNMDLDPDSENQDPENWWCAEKKKCVGLTEREGGGRLAGELPGNAGEDESLNQDLHGSSLRVQESSARLCPRPIKYKKKIVNSVLS
jgi:hypothetical protein